MSREMKHSGVAWIGELPQGWNIERIKTIYSERTELSIDGSEDLLSVSEYYGVAPRSSMVEDGDFISRSESLVGYKKCYKGDFVSNIMLAWKGSFGTTQYDGIVSPAYCVYIPSPSICPKYYHYLFRTDLYKTRFHLFSRGIIDSRLRLYSPFFFDVEAIIPPLAEQKAIADFLDKKCNVIDELVALQEKMIEELKAYKQSVITEAVCKGLNPNVPMKDSGIAWIGELPQGWNIERIKTIYSERTELSIDGSEDLLSVSEYYGVAPRSSMVESGDFISRSESLVGYKKCYKGDFVSNIMLAWKGSFGTTQYDGIVSPAYCVYIPSPSICPKYYHYLFRTDLYKTRFHLFSRGIIDSRLRLYSPFFFDVEAIIPPLAEQEEIADYLDKKCSEIDQLISIKQQKIVELNDYKKSLIYEYTTGKKEVKL